MSMQANATTGTAEARVTAAIQAIDEHEDEVRAFVHLDREGALATARRLDRGPATQLGGLSVGIKDIFDTADMPTAYGSPIYAGHRPAWDAAAVALIRRAGGVVLGKTVTTEFAARTPGVTRNPHNLAHTPGGSSSGSAAAVAAGMVDVAIGTQTGGSMIRPAAFCGVVGYKPTFDYISTAGVKPHAWSLDTVGAYARDVATAARLGSVLTGRTLTGDKPLSPPRVAVYLPPEAERADADAHAALARAREAAAEAGAMVVEVSPPRVAHRLSRAWSLIDDFEAARSFLFEYENHRDGLSDNLRQMVERGLAVSASDYDGAIATTAEGRAGMTALFVEADVILTFSAPGEAPEGLGSTGSAIFNQVWTLLGMPAVNVPGLTGAKGLPVGVQVVAPRHADHAALSVAAWLAPLLAQDG